MTPELFIDKWRLADLTERAAAHSHFIDLCRVLGEPSPTDADPKGERYAFERGATKTSGGEGWADVWKADCFGWEYKGKKKNLDVALDQLKRYALALDNPPLLIVCDLDRFRIVTNWTSTVSVRHEFDLGGLRDPLNVQKLKWAFAEPERLRPDRTRQAVTEEAAAKFIGIAQELRAQGHDSLAVARFVNRLVFCMFAEDVDLLPNGMFGRMLRAAKTEPGSFLDHCESLFRTMHKGGRIGFERIAWFNGGLFADGKDEAGGDLPPTALPLSPAQIDDALKAADLDWSEIDPAIMGTLFERGLDPDKRGQLGAHYTDRDKIMRIVEPVIVRPLAAEWAGVRARIEAEMARVEEARARRPATMAEARKVHQGARQDEERAFRGALRLRDEFLAKLRGLRVLDPACGSGNFLYLALHALKDAEQRALIECEALGLGGAVASFGVGPEQLLGLEVNEFAAELARVSVWIGEIQWLRRRGFGALANPVLRPLDTIACRDALLEPDGSPAEWPEADFIVGNPPWLGGKMLRRDLGGPTVDRMLAAYRGRVPAEADLACYWIEKAAAHVAANKAVRVGLVVTNSVRGGANRRTLDQAVARGLRIFDAWDDEPWEQDGAAVRASLVCLARSGDDLAGAARLDEERVEEVFTDLTARRMSGDAVDLTRAARLSENAGVAFMGDTKGGAFDVPGAVAREWLLAPRNPNGRPNSDVLRPWANGLDLNRRPRDMWIIDFGWEMSEGEAALYEKPFEYALAHVFPERAKNNRPLYKRFWWRHVEPRPGMWARLSGLSRYLATARNGRYRLFRWLPPCVVPDSQLIVIACDDDATFGILQSRFHEVWSLRLGSWLGVGNDPRYTPSTTFETFPFPEGCALGSPTGAATAAIAAAAERLDRLREAWLNPEDLVSREPEVATGYPDRPVSRPGTGRKLAELTLSKLYKLRPRWLRDAHAAVDEAVAAAYGWPADLSDNEALARLFRLNQERSAAPEAKPAVALAAQLARQI